MNYEEKELVELANKYCFDVYKNEVINSVVPDYTLVSKINNTKIAILKRKDENAKDVLELSGYRVMQTESLDFKKLEIIIRVFNRKDADRAEQVTPEPKKAATANNTVDKAYLEGSPSNWRYRNTKPYTPEQEAKTPKYAAGGSEDRVYDVDDIPWWEKQKRNPNIYQEKPDKKPWRTLGAIAVALVILAAIIKMPKANNAQFDDNGIFSDIVSIEVDYLETESPDKRLLVMTYKNTSYKPVTDVMCTVEVILPDGTKTYKKTFKVCESIGANQEFETSHIATVPTDSDYSIKVGGYCKTQII